MMEIIYHGHSCIQLVHGEQSLIVDPFISGNPFAKTQVDDIKVDYILLTHGHQDHMLDAAQMAKNNDATIIAIAELATFMRWQGAKAIDMNIGGQIDLGFAKVKMTQAFHSSGFVVDSEQQIVYLGMPAGFLIKMDHKTIYHAGDTGLFGDMKMIGELNQIDAAFLPIGDHYTMGPDDAVHAAGWLSADIVVPVHYDTFPQIKQDAEAFIDKLGKQGLKGKILNPGEKLTP
jgi:L-ascorbate metabolism protein UlaG (beta-lactamase superfamily)